MYVIPHCCCLFLQESSSVRQCHSFEGDSRSDNSIREKRRRGLGVIFRFRGDGGGGVLLIDVLLYVCSLVGVVVLAIVVGVVVVFPLLLLFCEFLSILSLLNFTQIAPLVICKSPSQFLLCIM